MLRMCACRCMSIIGEPSCIASDHARRSEKEKRNQYQAKSEAEALFHTALLLRHGVSGSAGKGHSTAG